jgi:hypothetical protein
VKPQKIGGRQALLSQPQKMARSMVRTQALIKAGKPTGLTMVLGKKGKPLVSRKTSVKKTTKKTSATMTPSLKSVQKSVRKTMGY